MVGLRTISSTAEMGLILGECMHDTNHILGCYILDADRRLQIIITFQLINC